MHLRVGQHPGILPMYEYSLPETPKQHRNPSWLVMPEATRIRTQLGESPPLEMVVLAVANLAETLAWLAQQGIFHRDIKPDNLYWYEGSWVLGDLGLVTFPGKAQLTTEGSLPAPANLVAPELLEGDLDGITYGPVDVYLIAKTLWMLATGRSWAPPGPQHVGVPGEVMESRVVHPRIRTLDNLVQRATDNDPTKRPSMKQFAAELRQWLLPLPDVPKLADLSSLVAQTRSLIAPLNRDTELRQQWNSQARALIRKFNERLKPFLADVRNQDLHIETDEFRTQIFSERDLKMVGMRGHRFTSSVAGTQHAARIRSNDPKYQVVCGAEAAIFQGGVINLLAGLYIQAGAVAGLYWWARRAFQLGSPPEDLAISEMVRELAENFPAAFTMLVSLIETPTAQLPKLFSSPTIEQQQQKQGIEPRMREAVQTFIPELSDLPYFSPDRYRAGGQQLLWYRTGAPRTDDVLPVWSCGGSFILGTTADDAQSRGYLEVGIVAELYTDQQLYLVALAAFVQRSPVQEEVIWSESRFILVDDPHIEQMLGDLAETFRAHLPAIGARFKELLAIEHPGNN